MSPEKVSLPDTTRYTRKQKTLYGGLLVVMLTMAACTPRNEDKTKTECQGEQTFGQIKTELVEAAPDYWRDRVDTTDATTLKRSYNDATCGVPVLRFKPENTAVPCLERITWGEIRKSVLKRRNGVRGPEDGRSLLRDFRFENCSTLPQEGR